MTERPAFYLFPYLRLSSAVTVGPWSLASLDSGKLAAATEGLGLTMKSLLARHRDESGLPLETATLVQRIQLGGHPNEGGEYERQALHSAVTFGVIDANAHGRNQIEWDAPGSDIATAEVATFFVGEISALEEGTFVRRRGGPLNQRTISGGTVHNELLVMGPPEGLVSRPIMDLDAGLMEAVYQVHINGRKCDATSVHQEVISALHWHSRAWENSPQHSMTDVIVQLKTAIEALSGQHRTLMGIPVLEGIYRSVEGTLGATEWLWRDLAPTFSRLSKGRESTQGAFAYWYWYLSECRNRIIHDTGLPETDHVAPGSPFEGNVFRVAERVTRELIKIRLAQLGYPEAGLSSSNRAALQFAKLQGLDNQISLIQPLAG